MYHDHHYYDYDHGSYGYDHDYYSYDDHDDHHDNITVGAEVWATISDLDSFSLPQNPWLLSTSAVSWLHIHDRHIPYTHIHCHFIYYLLPIITFIGLINMHV